MKREFKAVLLCLICLGLLGTLSGCRKADAENPRITPVPTESMEPDITATPEPTSTPETGLTKGDYVNGRLSKEELEALVDADLDTLRQKISTLADAVAYLDCFSPNIYNGFAGEIRLDVDFLLGEHRRPEATTPQTYAAFGAWCLGDDFEGIEYVIALANYDGILQVLPALALPVQEGYCLIAPHRLSKIIERTLALPGQNLHSLSNLKEDLRCDVGVYQIFTAKADQRELRFSLDEELREATPQVGEAQLRYPATEEEKNRRDAIQKEERIRFAQAQLKRNYTSYGMPGSMAPTLTEDQIQALAGQDLNGVAEGCKTLGDCLYYYALSGFHGADGDLRLQDEAWGEGYFQWHFNYGPEETFARGKGNCGASSGLTARLLQGDYPTVGILGMTFTKGEGGHFINYIFDGSRYHVFDVVNLLAIFDQSGFCFSSGDTLLEAARLWTERSGFPVKCIWAFERFEGDLPVGWDESNTSYLPRAYKDQGTILLETPEEGYVYEWVEISDAIWNRIQGMQNPAVAAGDGAAE